VDDDRLARQPDHAVTLTLRKEGERVTGSMQGDLGTAE
jgi:hypothetical protein